MSTVYNKLVRDKIIIAKQGGTPKYISLDDDAFFSELNRKLSEEVAEYLDGYDIEELADIAEVVLAIARCKGLTGKELDDMRLKKRDERGGFDKKLLLTEA